MNSNIYTKSYPAPNVNYSEILRYAGVRGEAKELEEIIGECLDELEGKLCYRVCYRFFDIRECGDALDLGFTITNSETVKKGVQGCDSLIVFSATVGIELDRLTYRYATVSPTKALLFQAIGAERIEALCDAFCLDIKKEYNTLPRLSAGYGDFPLEVQRDIFSALDCPRKIGLTLNESLLMSPTKSVTAIMGVKNDT